MNIAADLSIVTLGILSIADVAKEKWQSLKQCYRNSLKREAKNQATGSKAKKQKT